MIGWFRLRRGAYRARVLSRRTDPSRIVRGSPADRLASLDFVLTRAVDRSVLDIGCHDGTVAAAFARSGARHIDGCDMNQRALEAARARVEPLVPSARFFECDLAQGAASLRRLPLAANYDIVCYLGVHHHLVPQMPSSELESLLHEIAARALDLVAVRTSSPLMEEVRGTLSAAGMAPIFGPHQASPIVGPLCVFQRVARSTPEANATTRPG